MSHGSTPCSGPGAVPLLLGVGGRGPASGSDGGGGRLRPGRSEPTSAEPGACGGAADNQQASGKETPN